MNTPPAPLRIGDTYSGIASPIKLSRTPASYRLPPPVQQDQAGPSITTTPSSSA